VEGKPIQIMNKAWVQFLLVVVPVMSLVGAWLALRVVSGRRRQDSRNKADEQ
jgi:hypothetical protein